MGSPISTINLSGKLTSLTYMMYPSNELSQGLWNLSLYEVVVNTIGWEGNFAVGISCNLVRSLKYNKNNEAESCNPILATFVIKSNAITKYSFDSAWTLINSVEESLKIHFIDLETQKILNKECTIHVLIRLQRIK
jgi:hypothetical protein